MKKFQELTLKDNFMFSAVMMQGDNCKKLLEMILDIPISQVHIDYEKNIVYHPDYHGIRLDIIAKDEENTQYSVEMQVSHTPLTKRSRYYHSQIDSDLLLAGKGYDKLPDVYVIFICDYDPFGYGKYRYSQESYCPEAPQVDFDNGSYTIYLNTHGNNKEEVPEEGI